MAPAGEVPRAVEAGPGCGGEGIGDEALGGEGGLLHVAAGQAVAADEQLSGDAHGHRLAGGVQQVHLGVADGLADGDGGAHLLHRRHAVAGGEEGGLGGAVAGRHRNEHSFQHSAHVGGAHDVAAGEELLHATQGLEVVVHHLGEEAGGEVQRRHLVLGEHCLQFLQVGRRVGREDDETRSVEQRAPQLQGGGVEGDGGDEQKRLVRAEVCVVHAENGAQHGGVRSPDTLGPAGGAGGEVDVREAVGQGRGGRRVRGRRFHGHVLQHQRDEPLRGQLRKQCTRGDEHTRARILQHGGEALAGVRGVERDVGAAGLENGDEGDNQLQRALQRDGHTRVGGDAQATQVPGQLIGARVELPVGELRGSELAGELDSDLVREAGDHLREDVGQGGAVRVLGDGGIPVHQHLPALRLGQQGDGVQRRVGPVDERLHQHLEVLRHPLRGGALEQVGVVPQHPLVAPCGPPQVQLQLEPDGGIAHLEWSQHQPLHAD